MKFIADHDYHIHSHLSSCSSDPAQTKESILAYAEKNNLHQICLTDHFWDETVPGASGWYAPQNYPHIKESLPLPQKDGIHFYFGCETDMDKYLTVGISEQVMNELDFVIVPTTHLHMMGFTLDEADDTVERRAELYVKRFEALLAKKYPAKKVGIAHLTCDLIAEGMDYIHVLNRIPDEVFRSLFTRTARLGYGVELNMKAVYDTKEEEEAVMRPFRIAKTCGCQFYLGSDAHHPEDFEPIPEQFRGLIELLDLQESEKFRPFD